MSVCFVDLETTGLDPGRHDIWEIALIVDGATHLWHTKPDLAAADPNALRLNRFHERLAAEKWTWARKETVAAAVARLTAGRHLAGAVPSFDAGFLDVFLRRYGQCPAWHYHLVCVENLAAGTLRAEPPWNSTVLAEKLGVTISDEARHTALGDARWARDIYAAVMKEEKQP